jgi:hypothetical protein
MWQVTAAQRALLIIARHLQDVADQWAKSINCLQELLQRCRKRSLECMDCLWHCVCWCRAHNCSLECMDCLWHCVC